MKRKKLFISLVILVILIAVAAVIITIVFGNIERSLGSLKELEIKNVDLSKIPDGSYTGSFKEFPVGAEVRVMVKDHTITDITLMKHENGKGGGAETLPSEVLKRQSIEIDTVSGATYSSVVILKAIENALKSGLPK